MTWVHFMKEKAQVFKNFKKFFSLAEKQSGCTLRTLCFDNNKEYTSKQFSNFCANLEFIILLFPYSS